MMQNVGSHCPPGSPPLRLCVYTFRSRILLNLPMRQLLSLSPLPKRSSTPPCFPNLLNMRISAAAARIQAQSKTTSSTTFSFRSLSALQLLQESVQSQAAMYGSLSKCSRSDVKDELVHRRTLIGILTWLLPFLASSPAPAAADDFGDQLTLYKDDEQGYTLYVPEGWVKGEGKATGQRKVTAFFPANDTNTNVNIVVTNLGADFTSLGSFGPIDTFAENLVNGLDRSWQKPRGQSAVLVNASSRNGLYYLDYTLQKPGERMRHLLSVVGIGANGWYNQLFTVTGQVLLQGKSTPLNLTQYSLFASQKVWKTSKK